MSESVKISQGGLTTVVSISKNFNRFRRDDFTAPDGSLMLPGFIHRPLAPVPARFVTIL
jgi:hypothetical protein